MPVMVLKTTEIEEMKALMYLHLENRGAVTEKLYQKLVHPEKKPEKERALEELESDYKENIIIVKELYE